MISLTYQKQQTESRLGQPGRLPITPCQRTSQPSPNWLPRWTHTFSQEQHPCLPKEASTVRRGQSAPPRMSKGNRSSCPDGVAVGTSAWMKTWPGSLALTRHRHLFFAGCPTLSDMVEQVVSSRCTVRSGQATAEVSARQLVRPHRLAGPRRHSSRIEMANKVFMSSPAPTLQPRVRTVLGSDGS